MQNLEISTESTQHPCLNVCIVSETKKYALRNHKTVFAFFQYL